MVNKTVFISTVLSSFVLGITAVFPTITRTPQENSPEIVVAWNPNNLLFSTYERGSKATSNNKVFEVVKRLNERGVKQVLVCGPTRKAQYASQDELDYFQYVSPSIRKFIKERSNPSETVLVIDTKVGNIKKIEKNGMSTHLFCCSRHLENELKKLNVL